jgi:hypothetical protein
VAGYPDVPGRLSATSYRDLAIISPSSDGRRSAKRIEWRRKRTEKALRIRQDELEAHLLAAPAANWREAAEKARYLLNLFAASLAAQDPRRQKLIAAVIDDFERLARE